MGGWVDGWLYLWVFDELSKEDDSCFFDRGLDYHLGHEGSDLFGWMGGWVGELLFLNGLGR